MSRGLSCSVIIAAPSMILSIVLGWNLALRCWRSALPTVVYTMVGGVQAVTWTDVKQMGVVVFGDPVGRRRADLGLPDGMSLDRAARRRRRGQDAGARFTSFDLHADYTLWSGLIGGLFLCCRTSAAIRARCSGI